MKHLALLLPLLAACSQARVMIPAEESDPPGSGEAKLVVYRDSFRNATKRYAFFDDEELLGFSQTGSWFEARLAPGAHFFLIHGANSAGLRAHLQAGRTYYVRVDSDPELFHLQLHLTPIVPGMPEFERIDDILAGLSHRELDPDFPDLYSDSYSEDSGKARKVEAQLSRLLTEGLEECPILKAEDGR